MLRHAIAGIVAVTLASGVARATERSVVKVEEGTIVKVEIVFTNGKVDYGASRVTLKTAGGEETYKINGDTKFTHPKGVDSADRLSSIFRPGRKVVFTSAGGTLSEVEIDSGK